MLNLRRWRNDEARHELALRGFKATHLSKLLGRVARYLFGSRI